MNDERLPLVSVVTPVYNGDKYLDECIRSVLSQTYPNWELIIQNNASTDNTLAIAQKYAALDDRIRIYNTDSLLPIMQNWNLILRRISPDSKYCKVVHADDLLFSRCLEKMVPLAESHPSVGVVGSYGLSGDRVVCRGLSVETEFLPGRELCRQTLLNRVNCFWSPTSLMIRSDLIRKRRQFYNPSILHADVEACYQVLKESDFGFVHQILTFVRRHDESMTSLFTESYKRTIVSNLDLYLRFGPVFLSDFEYKGHLATKTRQYYHFLADSLFRLREKNFWRYHFKALEDLGLPFRSARLVHAALGKLVAHPLKTCTTVLRVARTRVR
jgi:glycosyltransferase involved in cell wall biosynthesis